MRTTLLFLSLFAMACSAPMSTPDSGTSVVVVNCPAPTSGPTMHDKSVSMNETWTADGSPHILTWDVYVRAGATLTIEPCAEIQLQKGLVLGTRDGFIVAEGTQTKPIRIHGQDGAQWLKLEFASPGSARLAWVDIEGGGGGDINDQDGAAVEVRHNGAPPGSVPVLFVDHVSIRGARGSGLAAFGYATFIAGSHDLTITNCGSTKNPYPLTLEEHSIDALPSGSYTGNLKDEFLLRLAGSGGAGDGLKVDATLHNRGIPYRTAGNFNVAANVDGQVSTLTIEPGVVIKMAPTKTFKIETWTGNSPASGVLRALGTADQPIIFTSASDTPAPGDWVGLWFGNVPNANNRLDHVIIEYAGANCGCSLATCSMINTFESAVFLTNRPAGGNGFITNTTFRHIKGHGVLEGWFENEAGGGLIDFVSSNTFDDVTGCTQTRPGNSVAGGCPSPKPACF